MLVAILQHIGDADDPYQIVATLMEAVPAGSYLAISHPARDIKAGAMAKIAQRMNELIAEKVSFRSHAEVARLLDGLELVQPGVVPVPRWRPDTDAEAASPTVMWAGVGRKP
jgi:hypothetical protein